jgi:cytochrome c-type biogenesis protein CcmE
VALTDAPEAVAGVGSVGPAGPVGPAPRVRPRGGGRRYWIALAVIAAALLVLVVQGLGNATVYFKTADEAVAQRAKLGSHRFRIEGTVQPGVHEVGQDSSFVIANNGASVRVLHHGDSPQLFKPGIPVVLEGRFDPSGTFASDRIMVKHTESYSAQHPDRVKTAETTIPTHPSNPSVPPQSTPSGP